MRLCSKVLLCLQLHKLPYLELFTAKQASGMVSLFNQSVAPEDKNFRFEMGLTPQLSWTQLLRHLSSVHKEFSIGLSRSSDATVQPSTSAADTANPSFTLWSGQAASAAAAEPEACASEACQNLRCLWPSFCCLRLLRRLGSVG